MTEQKRRNFTKEEKERIISLISSKTNIIECKKTDSSSLAEKENAWKAILEEFNSSNCSLPRTVVQLKAFYKNAKSETKKKIALNRASIFKTGGGHQEFHLDENDPLVSIVTAQTLSLENHFDSSKELFENQETLTRSTESRTDINKDIDVDTDGTNDLAAPSARRKRPRRQVDSNNEKLLEEVLELKKQKTLTDIEKNKLKIEVYKKKFEILQQYQQMMQ